MNQKKLGSILSYLNILVTIISQFAYTPIMLRILGQSEYGVFSLSQSVIGYLSLLNFGFSGSYLRFYSKYVADGDNEGVKRLNAMYVIVFAGISTLICIGGFFIIQNIEQIIGKKFNAQELALTRLLMVILTINMAVMMPNNAFCTFIFAQEKFIFNKGMELLRSIGNPLICLPVLLLGYGSIGMSYVMLVLSLISLAMNIYYCVQKIKLGFIFTDINWRLLIEIASFSFYIFLWSIVDQLNWQIGRIILSNTSGSAAVAVFAVGTQFCMMFLIFSTSLSGVFVPSVYKLVHESDAPKKITDLMIKVGRLQFYIVFFIWLGFVVFGKPFINMWAGPQYMDAYWVGLLLMTPVIIALTQNIGIEVLRAYNKHQLRTWLHFFIAAFNVLVSFILAEKYGIIGCSIGTCIATFLSSTVVANLIYIYVIKLEIGRFFAELLSMWKAVLVTLIIGFGIMKYTNIDSFGSFIGLVLLFSISYAIAFVMLAFNKNEKEMLKSFALRLRRA